MEAIKALKTRRSCRSFTDEQLKEVDLQVIIDCGLNAPSGSNRQDTKIIVVQNEDKIRTLSRLNASVTNTKIDPFYGAKTICLIVAQKDSGYKEEAFQLNPVKNASLLIGAMQTAAFSINVGSCWINCCKEMLDLAEGQEILEKLGLRDYQGVGSCVLGYPNETLGIKKIKEGRVIYY